MLQLAELQKKINEAVEKCYTSHRTLNKGISHNTETFVKKAPVMMTYGMMTFTMIALLLMTLSLYL
jgi:pilus assembly protein TadC